MSTLTLWRSPVGAGALTIATMLLQTPALGAPPTRFTADASFESAGGCVASDVFVFVDNGRIKDKGARGQAVITLVETDECVDEILLQAVGKANLKADELQVAPDLSSATLTSRIRLRDAISKNSIDLDLDLSWQAVEPPTVSMTNVEVEEPGQIVRLDRRATRTLRSAEAAGSIVAQGKDFAPEPATEATLGSTR